jgi:hypothetical protein
LTRSFPCTRLCHRWWKVHKGQDKQVLCSCGDDILTEGTKSKTISQQAHKIHRH